MSKYPTNLPLYRRSVRGFLSEEGPKRDECAATHGRKSLMRVLSNIFRNGAAKAPVSLVMEGASRHSESCKGVTCSCHPKRTSCAFSRGCKFHSCENNKHSSKQRAVKEITTNTVTSGVLRRLNVSVYACAESVKPIRVTSFGGRRVRRGTFCVPSTRTTIGTNRCLRRYVGGRSDTNNIVRYHVAKAPTKLNRPIFSGLDTLLTRTLVSVNTIGTIRVNSNVTIASSGNSASGSKFAIGSNRVVGASGRTNKVVKKVDSNDRVVLHTRVGPAPSVDRPRRAMAGSGRPLSLRVRNQRSPIVIPETIIIMRSVTTVALTSTLFIGVDSRVSGIQSFCQGWFRLVRTGVPSLRS